jgi:hypothetical protein
MMCSPSYEYEQRRDEKIDRILHLAVNDLVSSSKSHQSGAAAHNIQTGRAHNITAEGLLDRHGEAARAITA